MRIVMVLLIFLLIAPIALSDLRINEIYPAPSDGQEEWVELFNNSDQSIDISTYKLKDSIGTNIPLQNTLISPHGFVLGIANGVLNNSGDDVLLLDPAGVQIDSTTYPSGYNSSQSHGRCPDGGSWLKLNSQSKSSSNDAICGSQAVSPTNAPGETPSNISPTVASVDYDNIIISEAMVYPDTNQSEWVELYNNNDFAVVLTNWYLDDGENSGSTPKTFSLSIGARNFAIVELTTSIYNNDADAVRLLNGNQVEKNSFSYSNAERNKSWGRTFLPSGGICLQESSRAVINSSCINNNNSSNNTGAEKNDQTPTIASNSTTSTSTNDENEIEDNTIYRDHINPNTNTLSQKGSVKGASTERNSDTISNSEKNNIRSVVSAIWLVSTFNLVYAASKITKKHLELIS